MKLKICTIGCGGHSTLVHGPSHRKYAINHPDTILAGCCDLDIEKANTYKEKFGYAKTYTDMYEMLNTEKPDAVCIIVPVQFVCETAVAVMELGYHVLLEKPPGLCKEETFRLIETANKMNVINHVAFNRRHIPFISKLKEELRLLPAHSIQTVFYDFYRYNRREATFETTAIHGIDAVKDIIGSNYEEVRFTYQEMPDLGVNVKNILLECRFENGVLARINFCPCSGVTVERICVNALNHTFFVKTPIWNGFDTPGEFVHIEKGNCVSNISENELNVGMEMFETNGFYRENELFFENVRNGIQGTDTIASSLQSVEIAEALKNRKDIWVSDEYK